LLAFLMNEIDYRVVLQRCDQMRSQNRQVFNQIFEYLSAESFGG